MTVRTSAAIRPRRAAAILAAAALTLATAGCGGSDDDASASGGTSADGQTTIRVVTAVSNSYWFLPIQQAEALGTFEGTGLDVQVIDGTTPTLGQILASGDADVALGGGTTEAALREQGIEQTIVGSNYAPWGMHVVANDNTDAQSIEDLEGANFGITGAGAPSDYSVHKIAQELGWATSDYQTTSFGDVASMVAGFRSGAVDAIIWGADTAFSLEDEGSGRILGSSADYVGPTVLEAFSVMDEFGQENSGALRTFFEAYYAEVAELQADPQQFIDTLVQQSGYSQSVAEKLAEEELPLMSADGKITSEQLTGLSEGAAFSTGDRTNENPIEAEYSYWADTYK